MLAHPADLPRGYAGHQRIGLDVAINYGASRDESILANSNATDDSAVGAKRCTLSDEGAAVFVLAGNCRARIVDVGEDHTGATENVILKGNVIVDRDVVLHLGVVADDDLVADEDVLAERTVFADLGSATDMYPVPDSRAFADLRAFVDYGGGVDSGGGVHIICHGIARKARKFLKDEATDFGFGVCKVDQEANLDAGGFEVIEQLGFMGFGEFVLCLEFEKYFLIYDDIGNVLSDEHPFVVNRETLLRFYDQSDFLQFNHQCVVIDLFQKTRTKLPKNLEHTPSNGIGQFFLFHSMPFRSFRVPPCASVCFRG